MAVKPFCKDLFDVKKSINEEAKFELQMQGQAIAKEYDEESSPVKQRRPYYDLGIEIELFQCNDKARILPLMDSHDAFNPTCNPIDSGTLAQALNQKIDGQPMVVIDCRFDYEFQAGHIRGAVNIDNVRSLERFFLQDLQKLRQLMQTRTILVFHCEYSEKRGPQLWRELRNLDRKMNAAKFSTDTDNGS